MSNQLLLRLVAVAALVVVNGAVLRAQSNYATPYAFTTLAGKVTGSPGSTDGTGSAARFYSPAGVAVDGAGSLYVADLGNHTIRKITAGGVVTTLAGTAGSPGAADGTGSAARFNSPFGVAVDGAGNVYVADTFNHTIRKITAGGVVTTLAGTAGSAGWADGTGNAARFYRPYGVAVDSTGNVFVADTYSCTIRKITAGGVVTTLAGTAGSTGATDGTGSAARFNTPTGVAVDSAGNVFVADKVNSTIRKITGGGTVTTLAGSAGSPGAADGTGNTARFANPIGVAVDYVGNLYVAEHNHTIRKVTGGGVVTTLAGTAGSVGWADGTGGAAQFNYPSGVAADSAGTVYVADYFNHTIRQIAGGGAVTTLAGTAGSTGFADGLGSAARFYYPSGVAVDGSGNLYVADNNNSTIRKVTSSGVVTTLAGTAGSTGSADGFGSAARFYSPRNVAVDGAGNVYVADNGSHTIRQITSGGAVTTLAGAAFSSGSTDGTGSAARFYAPFGLAADSAGNIYVADTGNSTIRKITSGGVVTTLAGMAGSSGATDGLGSAARFASPTGVAVDGSGNLYVVDTGNSTIRKITSGGVVTTLAGTAGSTGSVDGLGSAARFDFPSGGVAVDGAGSVYVADTNNCAIRKITSGGMVTTLAGTAGSQGSADGAGSAAGFFNPSGMAVDGAGNVYVADTFNHTIRRGALVPPAPPGFTGTTTAGGFVGLSFIYSATFSSSPTAYSVSGLPDGLSFDAATGMIFGTPTVAGMFTITFGATNSAGTGSATLTLTVSTVAGAPGRLVNLSVRTGAGTGDRTLIVGVVIGGSGTSGAKPLLIRGVGPTLADYGVGGALADPGLQFFLQGATTPLAANDNWGGAAQITAVGNAVGAFPLGSATSQDAALYLTPASDVYSVKVAGADGTTGIALAEIYDASGLAYTTATPRLINVSARAQVGTGDGVLIAGFVIEGATSRTVLIRAVGPTLANYGVGGFLADPQLELTQTVSGATVVIAGNDNWGGNAQIVSLGHAVGAFALASSTSQDAALLVTLPPGIYSAKASGVGNTTGVALIEVYEVP